MKRKHAAIGFAAWCAVSTVALFSLTAHGTIPGQVAASPREVPASLRREGRATLVMIAHPHCPCTRASLHELEHVLAGTARSERRSAVDVVILFAQVRGAADRISDELHAVAARIPGARVVDDRDAMTRLGARTSGTVLFYDTSGTLRFSGGITRSRGHEGRSAGGDAIRDLILAPRSPNATPATPVFGCPLPPATPSADHP